MKLELKGVQLGSLVLSSVPAVLFFLGVLGGVITFFFVQNPQVAYMGFGQKLLAVSVFSLLYMLLMAALIVIAAFIYNILTTVVGLRGVRFEIEELAEGE
ncbi:MAG: hypothetical protein FD189_346 [Elusimicrobia bacterium]|nr:MAG: hypothetical protein FD154_426 [Elusimicrobiota bacterium]KAF0157825.1 MAG: hypothetical protein FD189_346 [Elusimicrobiota bacterium]